MGKPITSLLFTKAHRNYSMAGDGSASFQGRLTARHRQRQSAHDDATHLLRQEGCCRRAAQLRAWDPLSWRQPSLAALPSQLEPLAQHWPPCPPALKAGAALARQPLPWPARQALSWLQQVQRLQASPERPLPPEQAAAPLPSLWEAPAQSPARLRLFWAALLMLLQARPVLLLQAWAMREAASSSLSPTRGQTWAGGWSLAHAVAVMNEMPALQT